MRYRIVFASNQVGQSRLDPFEIDTPETVGASARTVDLSRVIRGWVVDALTAGPGVGAEHNRAVIEQQTQITVDVGAGQGAAYYGTDVLGQFAIYPFG